MPIDLTSAILLLDFAAKATPSIAALVDQVKGGETITQAEIDAATAAKDNAAAHWDAAADPQESR